MPTKWNPTQVTGPTQPPAPPAPPPRYPLDFTPADYRFGNGAHRRANVSPHPLAADAPLAPPNPPAPAPAEPAAQPAPLRAASGQPGLTPLRAALAVAALATLWALAR